MADIKENLSTKETDELLQIWNDNNRAEWTDIAFSAIEEILTERGVTVPPQPNETTELKKKINAKSIGGISIGTIIAYAIGTSLAEEYGPIVGIWSLVIIVIIVVFAIIFWFLKKDNGVE